MRTVPGFRPETGELPCRIAHYTAVQARSANLFIAGLHDMTLTVEMLSVIEHEANGVASPTLDHSRRVVCAGMTAAPADVKEYGRALLLKLEHLIRCARAEQARAADGEEYLAPWITCSTRSARPHEPHGRSEGDTAGRQAGACPMTRRALRSDSLTVKEIL